MKAIGLKVLGVVLAVGSFLSMAYGYSGGDGSEATPFEIANVADWQQFMGDTGNWDKHFNLTDNINLDGVALIPVGNDSKVFTGIFDGQRFALRNVVINQPSNSSVGLFKRLGTGGQIKDLGVEDVAITGHFYVGGLVGWNEGNITFCYATGAVSGTGPAVGGLVGGNIYGNISGTITSCYATGAVSGTDSDVGGLVGSNGGAITSCYATGAVSGTAEVGGLVGSSYNNIQITSCYATGAVSGNSEVGGLVGSNGGAITSCYATGAVSGTAEVGGLVGRYDWGAIMSSFWDIQTSGQAGSRGGKGLTTQQMKTMFIFQNVGWADKGWVMEDGLDTPRLAWENTGGVPIPVALPVPLAGSGTESDPYQIVTPADFALLSWYAGILDKHLRLMNDIDLAGVWLYPIGDLGPFTGVFNGNGHAVHNAVINQPGNNNVGLFGGLDSGGQIKDLGVEDVAITGHSYVGGLVGDNDDGTITSCYATGAVSGSSYYVGGLVGGNYGDITSSYATGVVSGSSDEVGGLVGGNNGDITSSYATGAVSGRGGIGGLVGYSDESDITSCYATGAVSGSSDEVGGLVGGNNGDITSCYATGAVSGRGDIGGLVGTNGEGVITSCFWDIQTSGQTTSAGGQGQTTAQMKDIRTYLYAGWDFTMVWWLPPGDYPRLVFCERFSGGSGTALDPWKINTIGDWVVLMNIMPRWQDHFVLGADLDFSSQSLRPIGNVDHAFGGVFDGQGHVVRHAVIRKAAADYIGLFGVIGETGQVRSLMVKDADMTGRYYVGGLVGYNQGEISQCRVEGKVTAGGWYAGGLAGSNDAGVVMDCSANVAIRSSDWFAGGLLGENYGGAVSDCYARGPVRGDGYAGGLVGSNNGGEIVATYATGAVSGGSDLGGLAAENVEGTIQGSFWDTQTTGQPTSAGGEGKTTSLMKTQATFIGASWDFADTWSICEGTNYPRLTWDIEDMDWFCPDGVGTEELAHLVGMWLETNCGSQDDCQWADINQDGKVNLADFCILAANWLEGV